MTARVYPYTGGDPGSPYFDAVPTWLNDLLLEQTPGREMRNFRLKVRKAWIYDVMVLVAMEEHLRGIEPASTTRAVLVEILNRIDRADWPQTREEEDRRAQQA